MANVKIMVKDNGAFRVTGDVELVDFEGNAFETKEAFSLCRCGLSTKMPFCDGSHKGKFQSVVRASKSQDDINEE
ncbi:CDGSH iron-sulfur domain-containing protein [Ectobacillus polymachus]|uniref:CDGSH iron-sulfur domain-containing protein n=1 Tax=Ectobacillus polymachus TaxID=1508806 RepID=UPI003A89B893